MNQLLELSPLIVFFAAFEFLDIYWATAALMLACVLLLVVHRSAHRQIQDHAHHHRGGGRDALGTATLLLHDRRFIQWKPTVLLGADRGSPFSAAWPSASSRWRGACSKRRSTNRCRSRARTWLLINCLWAAWFALLAAANIYVARNFAESVWVKFKVFGITAAMHACS